MASITAIGSPVFPNLFGAGKSTAALEAQLAQYQIKLADWVSCPSCNTPEGKAKIQELSNKVNDMQQRIKAADAPPQRNPSSGQVANPATPALRDMAVSDSMGNLLDAFA